MADPHKDQERPPNMDETAHLPSNEHVSRPEQTPLDMPAGSGLGKYRILERVGKTYYAHVYKARDTLLDRLVTVKQMHPALIDDPMACGDFRREAQFLARVPKDARHVVNIHELIEDRRGLFIIEEYIPGQSLELMIAKQQVDTTDSVRLLKSGCLGLRTLHSLRIVHRDIRPANLLVGKQGQLRISNLGCSVHEGDITAPRVISSRYAAPELQAGDDHDSRVDIYSLGFIIYEMCVGRRKLIEHIGITATNGAEVSAQWARWHADPAAVLPNAMEMNTLVAPALSEILTRMTAKDLNERFSSVEEVLAQLAANFSIERASLQKRQPTAGSPRFLEIWPARGLSSVSYQTGHPLGRTGSQGLSAWSITADQVTTTHTAQSIEVRAPRHVQSANVSHADANRSSGPRRRALPHRPRKALAYNPPAPVKSAIADHETEVELVRGRKHRRWLSLGGAALVALIALTIFMSWNRVWQGTRTTSPAEKMLSEAMIAYDTEDYDAARTQFNQVLEFNVAGPEMRSCRETARRMLLMVEGQFALRRDDFDAVQKVLEQAQVGGGLDTHILRDFQRKYWNKKDAYRLAAESVQDMSSGHFSKAEARIDEYKEKAADAGLDPTSLQEHVERNREERRFQDSMVKAREMLDAGDYDGASLVLRDAEAIRTTSDTRELRQKIVDGKRRDDLLIRGDKAMMEDDFIAAQSSYEAAIEIHPSEEVEEKLRTAASELSFNYARKAIEKGNLLEGKRLLEDSLWKHPNPKARNMLVTMASEFEAANLVRKGDQAANAHNQDEAIRLYKKALKNLPDNVKPSVEKKLADAQSGKFAPVEKEAQPEPKVTPLDDKSFPR